MMNTIKTRLAKRNEHGFVVVLLAISMLALITIMGFAVDVGSWYLNASRLQRAADSAALSGTAALPDSDAAKAAVLKSLQLNGFNNNSNGIVVSTTVNATDKEVGVQVENNNVQTYFTHMLFSNLSMSRSSTARQASSTLELGSPYNVLGAGPINSASPIPKQNYWLSINGLCAPVEDGDYFSSYGGYKTGLDDSAQNSTAGFFPASNQAKHVCNTSQPSTNPNYTTSGYKYYVDIPPATTGSVTLAVFDGEHNPGNGADDPGNIDRAYRESTAEQLSGFYTDFHVFNPEGQDIAAADRTFVIEDSRAESKWVALYTLDSTETRAGGVWSITVSENISEGDYTAPGANSYALGAFRNTSQDSLNNCSLSGVSCPMGCDSRKTANCPRVYAQNAMSVLTGTDTHATNADFSFAEVDPSNFGRTFYIYLWDPGDGGTKDIKLLDGNNRAMSFKWSADGKYMPYPLSDTTTVLNTSGMGPCPLAQTDHCSGLSNNYKFNDRLVTLQVTVDQNYVDDVKASGNDWVSLHYDFTDHATPDRTTWGISLTGGSSSPPRLVRSDAN